VNAQALLPPSTVRFARDRTLLTFARRIPGLKRETWGTPILLVGIQGWWRLLLFRIGVTSEVMG
jgi:hypothetical protein